MIPHHPEDRAQWGAVCVEHGLRTRFHPAHATTAFTLLEHRLTSTFDRADIEKAWW